MLSEFPDLLLQLHECESHFLDLGIFQGATFHAADRLSLEKFSQQFDQAQYQAGEALLNVLGITVQALSGSARDRREFLIKTFDGLLHLVGRNLFWFVAQGSDLRRRLKEFCCRPGAAATRASFAIALAQSLTEIRDASSIDEREQTQPHLRLALPPRDHFG